MWNIQNETLDKLESIDNTGSWFNMPSGQEHYRLLRYISPKFEYILDVGTYLGHSAYALSGGKNVWTFDLVEHQLQVNLPDNVHRNIGNVLESNIISKMELILLDTYHNGDFEQEFIEHLEKIKWKGFLLADDIYLNKPMREWWNNIKQEKKDLTSIGHYTGTGLIIFK